MINNKKSPSNKLEGNEFDSAELPPSTDPRWQLWGPYMSQREWGTVRETGGLDGSNWAEFPYEQAASVPYRYCEDGIFGVCDRDCRVCHSYAFWNYRDDHLKERFYGLTNSQGAHGEDVKEVYSYKAADPQYKYIGADFLYPQTEYPYRHLHQMERLEGAADVSAMNSVRSAAVSLTDFNNWYSEQRYFEMEFEMCKLTPERLYLQLSITNCSALPARLVAMPMLFLRNTWSPGQTGDDFNVEKVIQAKDNCLIVCFKDHNKEFHLGYYFDSEAGVPEILLTDNVNSPASKDASAHSPSKDAFHRYITRGDSSGLIANLGSLPASKAGICYRLNLAPKQQIKLRCFLMSQRSGESAMLNWKGLTSSMEMVRLQNNVDTYQSLPGSLVPAEQDILNAAYTNLLWNRQYYPLDQMPHLWRVLSSGAGTLPNRLVTVPDKWEQPYLAAWDTAVHCLCLSCFDRRQAIDEMMLLMALIREDGSMYADEYRPEGVTPPLSVLAAVDLYSKCNPDEQESMAPLIYDRLHRHLDWWLQRRDARGVALIDGGICGVDYVSLFPRELVETGEGLIWALFFELSLAIYSTCPGDSALRSTIEINLPKLIESLGRLCALFVRCVVQENGLYHPYWLDVGFWSEVSGGSSSNLSRNNKQQQQETQRRPSSIQSESIESNASIDGSCVSFSGVVERFTGSSSGLLTSSTVYSGDSREETVNRCPWLHAYCYLPIICCCSLPNVRLDGGDTIEDLLARAFNNGSSDWETRAPYVFTDAGHSRLFVSVINSIQLSELLEQVLSEVQFLSQYGIRTMSMLHTCDTASVRLSMGRRESSTNSSLSEPEVKQQKLASYTLSQEFCPGASVSSSYGGNTNWYGGINLPYNYLLLEAMHRWSTVLDKKFDLIEYPSYSGRYKLINEIVQELASRNAALFLPNSSGVIPSTGLEARCGLQFYETFDGDTGRGHGAAHKGGWSAIIVRILMLMHGID
uniref:Glucosidase n=1 Tax=Macrostomum lignano TaxID=282301 RepID=A0A1I8JB63_9PLAT